MTTFDRYEIARIIVQNVAELSDRSSPEDRPELMLVTADELRDIVLQALPAIPSPTAQTALQRIADDDVDPDLKGRADILSGIAFAALSSQHRGET